MALLESRRNESEKERLKKLLERKTNRVGTSVLEEDGACRERIDSELGVGFHQADEQVLAKISGKGDDGLIGGLALEQVAQEHKSFAVETKVLFLFGEK